MVQTENLPGIRKSFANWVITGLLVTFAVAITTSLKVIFSGDDPIQLLYFVASSVVGKEAFYVTAGMALLGALLHSVVSFSWVAAFFALYSKFEWPNAHWKIASLLIGVIIWSVMFFIVMPLSLAPRVGFDLKNSIIDIFLLTISAGLPISYLGKLTFWKR